MRQLTLRIDDALAERLREVARGRGESVNSFAGAVLQAATDPDLAGSDAEQVRERLARAGLLAAPLAPVEAPAGRELDAARAAAGSGRPLSEFVSEGRR
ncbi:MAG TPA: hypothetical protein VNT32_04890 [Thermoleophilaceae bacterium]|nr:hypothetical protein [Thermoleophilaceae bacterium]